ncbi:hypothetical protein [Amycolatopsis sp. WQ 127309]|uniref:hypothetical protein n=1 Tax=Amycolatopsis sp. WQ 127309 TaxID=2932773 RepID=UPI001FF3F14F|nr:hypothetical protein [Amycolatopsis sp. WQ 127309]UOZ06002.1 hypothetical protein MUY22_45530 [Amycolatopsis sp. WQ 127309]
MGMTNIGRSAAAVLCAGGLALTVPDVASTTPSAGATVTQCVSGVRRVQVTCRHTPQRALCAVGSTWIPFGTLCVKGDARTA